MEWMPLKKKAYNIFFKFNRSDMNDFIPPLGQVHRRLIYSIDFCCLSDTPRDYEISQSSLFSLFDLFSVIFVNFLHYHKSGMR